MANPRMKLPSGADVEIQMASFDICNRLLKAVMKEIEGVPVSLGLKGAQIDTGKMTDEALNTIKSVVARLISSDKIEPVLWECMATVLYNGARVSRETFEPGEARADYLPLAKEVMVHNLGPFFKNLDSMLPFLTKKAIGDQK